MSSVESVANVIPWIEGEEDKIEMETLKILGRMVEESVETHPMKISAQVSRVPVLNGHTEMVSVELGERVSGEEIVEAFREFSGAAQALRLPSAPQRPIAIHEEQNRPQPRLDAESAHGHQRLDRSEDQQHARVHEHVQHDEQERQRQADKQGQGSKHLCRNRKTGARVHALRPRLTLVFRSGMPKRQGKQSKMF